MRYLLGQHLETFSALCTLRFLQIPPCKIHWATCTTHQNTEETLSLPYIWRKDKQSTYLQNTARPQALFVSLGVHIHIVSALTNYCVLCVN